MFFDRDRDDPFGSDVMSTMVSHVSAPACIYEGLKRSEKLLLPNGKHEHIDLNHIDALERVHSHGHKHCNDDR